MGEIPPNWINSEFLEEALRSNGIHPNLTVVSYNVKRAALAGDHYASEMYRVTLETKENGETEEISIIIKCKLRGGELSQIVDQADIFFKEAMTFTDIHIPLLSILKDAYGDNLKPIAAKCIYTSTEPEAIILEDLKKEGFRLANLTDGLDLKHCLMVMRAIAKYHAASLILRLQDPSRFKLFEDNFFTQDAHNGMSAFFSSTVRSVRDEINTWPGYEKYMGTLNALESAAIDHWVNGVRRDEAGFNVLIHGDLWMNNMMFRYSEGSEEEVEDIRLVDFQLSYLGSPATDLQYFMNSSASFEVLVNDRHVLIEEYYKTLCDTLSKLGHQNLQPTKDVLNSELDKRGLFGALTGFTIRAFVQADRDHLPDIDNIMKNNATLHLTEPYKDVLKKLLPFYEKWGWLKI